MSDHHKEYTSIYLGTQATVFQAEVTAIMEASIEMLKERLENYNINIHIDSQAAI